MISTKLDQATLRQINPLDISQYLRNTGWTPVQSKRTQINIFTIEREGIWFEITLPLNRDFQDYADAMNNVVQQIAELENRLPVDIVSMFTLPAADVVRFRRAGTTTRNGTIPFEEGLKLFENAKKALYVVACDLLQPEIYHKRLSMKIADEFIEKCSFGQTERGSYVATIVCPFIQLEDVVETRQLSLFDDGTDYGNSFTRRVTTRLMQSLERVFQALEHDQLGSLQQTDEPNEIISGNLLEALLDLNGSTDTAEIEISTQWAAIAPQSRGQVPTSVRFNSDTFQPLEVAVEHIQNQSETVTRQGEFVGRISLIQAEPDIDQRKNGEIILNTFDLDGKVIKPRITISPEEFELAIKAMREGLNVRVRGILRSQRRGKTLEYTSLELLD